MTNLDNLYKIILESHDVSLIKKNEAPNSNRIIHLYNDGEITNQKGGHAYLQRSEFTDHFKLNIKLDPSKFPKKIFDNDGNIITGYIITTYETAFMIRNLMIENLKT